MPCLSTQDYEPGDIILSECQAFIKFLFTTSKGSRCDACFKSTPSPLQCTGCKQMFYCDEKCKLEDWENGHKLECQLGDAFSENISFQQKDSLFLRQMLRIFALLKLKPEEGEKPLPLPNGESISFNQLLDYEWIKTNNPYIIKTLGLLKKLLEGGGHLEPDVGELFCKVFSIYNKSALSFPDEKQDKPVGHGLYVQPCAFDHSCKPNAFLSFKEAIINIRAIGPIKKGESISISYISQSHMGRNERRKKLKERYGFDCNCERCEANENAEVDVEKLKKSISNIKNSDFLTDNFPKVLKIHEEIVATLRILYHEYDHRITHQYVSTFSSINSLPADVFGFQKLDKTEKDSFLKDLVKHVYITYGKNNPLFGILAAKPWLHSYVQDVLHENQEGNDSLMSSSQDKDEKQAGSAGLD